MSHTLTPSQTQFVEQQATALMQARRERNAAHAARAARRGGHHTQASAGVSAAADREALMDEAIHQGVIGGALREHYATCYDRDPSGTRAYLQSLGLRAQATPAVPAAASGDEYVQTHLSAAERGRISAAREGRSPRVISGGL
jgi:hypothetical protein